VFLKCENFQKVGAFKARGACNAVLSLDEATAARGVVTHSSGNHAQALAWAASLRGIPAHIVMPTNAPPIKRRAVEGYGGTIYECEPTVKDREHTAARVANETGATLIPPYDDPRVIAGQGTCALELLGQVPDLDAIICPVGGGGMLSGSAIATKALSPKTTIYAAEPKQADDAFRSKVSGKIEPMENPDTIADGLRTTLGEHTFPVLRDLVEEVRLVSESEIAAAMRLVMERAKIVVEPSGAVGIAAVCDDTFNQHHRVGVIVTGGNLDLNELPKLLQS
jgi:threonine dehydratase